MSYMEICPPLFLWYVDILLYLCSVFINPQKITIMKKTILLFATCLLGMCNLAAQSLPGTPIYFYDVYAIMPLDDPYNGDGTGRPDPTRVIGGINRNDLNISIVGDAGRNVGEVVVINLETGDTIVDEEFIDRTLLNIPNAGTYTAYVIVDGTTYAGEFVVN